MASSRHSFSVDLEEWFHGIELPLDSLPRESRLHAGLDPLLGLLDRCEVRATFFVLGAVAERYPATVRSLLEAGHEIASHGNAHEFVYRQTPDEFRDDLRRANEAIARACGLVPRGYRAPYFSIREDTAWAWEILVEEGFEYDSSVFPVHNDRYGIPDAPREPHVLETPSGSLTEVPMTPLPLLGVNLPFSGGAYLRILPWWVQVAAWWEMTRRGERVIAYIHPWELDPDHPRVPLRRRVALTHYARLHLTERRLGRLLNRFEFGRIDEHLG